MAARLNATGNATGSMKTKLKYKDNLGVSFIKNHQHQLPSLELEIHLQRLELELQNVHNKSSAWLLLIQQSLNQEQPLTSNDQWTSLWEQENDVCKFCSMLMSGLENIGRTQMCF